MKTNNNLESLLNENLTLKKALNIAKIGLEKSEYDYGCLKQLYEEIKRKNQELRSQYDTLIKKNHNFQTQKMETQRYMESKIYELKQIIQNKQKQIQQIQTKIIPSFDHDMIRVKLIAQMEGPYQQTIQKKQIQIQKYKKQSYESDRKANMLSIKLENLKQQYQRQIAQTKEFYKSENNKLNNQFNNLLNWNQGRQKQKGILKKLKKQIEDLRVMLDMREKEVDQLRMEKDQLRQQKNQYMFKYANRMNQQKSQKNIYQLQIHKFTEKLKIKDNQIEELNKQIYRSKQQVKDLRKKFENKSQQAQKNDEKLQQLKIKNNQIFQQLYEIKNEKQNLKRELRATQKNIDFLNRQLQKKTNEIQKLNIKISQNRNKQNNQYNYSQNMEEFSNKKQKMDSIQMKELIQKLRKQNNELKIKYQANIAQKPQKQKQIDDQKTNLQSISLLNDKIKILKIKLGDANRKILELIKQKIKYQADKTQKFNYPFQNIHIPERQQIDLAAYQARDASLTPLIPTKFGYGRSTAIDNPYLNYY